MSETTLPPAGERLGIAAARRGGGQRQAEAESWLVGGVAAELATRLHAHSGFIRLLFVVAGYVNLWPAVVIYCLLALLLAHDGRRLPGWSNLVGLLRTGGFLLLGMAGGQWLQLNGGVFNEAPAVWIPVAGTVALTLAVALRGRRAAYGVAAAEDRRVVLCALAPVAVMLGLAAVVVLAPTVRADRLLELALIALGLGGAVANRRLNTRAFILGCLPLGMLAVVITAGGASLSGGVGDITVGPAGAGAHHLYRRAVGDIRLNLFGLHAVPPGGVSRWSASVGVGRIELDLPSDALTTVTVSIGAGSLAGGYGLSPSAPYTGFMLRRTLVITPRQASGGVITRPSFRLEVSATVGKGCVVIESASSESQC